MRAANSRPLSAELTSCDCGTSSPIFRIASLNSRRSSAFKIDSIKKAEDRLLFKDAMRKIGLDVPQSQLVNSADKGLEFAARIGYPVILRPSFTLGGTGGG